MGAYKYSNERGQSMILVALMVFAFAAMLALVLDGGTAYALRRKAQNSADAGALAGAQYLCSHRKELDVTTTAGNIATDYAVTRNGATYALAMVNASSHVVTVTASIRQESFFAGLIGSQVYTPTATATARCFPAAGGGVIPIAWACRDPISGVTDPNLDCAMYTGPDHQYLIMDTIKVLNRDGTIQDFYCQDPPNSGQPPNTLDCDYDNDGVDDFLGRGDRSWLDLNGGAANADETISWITGASIPPELFPHTWYPDRTGLSTSQFDSAKILVGKEALIPIFDAYCQGDPYTVCPDKWDTAPLDTTVAGGGESTLYYHVVGFALFHVTCVDSPAHGGAFNEDGSNKCPMHDAAVADLTDFKPNNQSIEGYFIEGLVTGHGTGSWDWPETGAYVVRLIR